MNVIWLNFKGNDFALQFGHLIENQLLQALANRANQYFAAIFGAPYQVVGYIIDCVASSLSFHKQILAQVFDAVKPGKEKKWKRVGLAGS